MTAGRRFSYAIAEGDGIADTVIVHAEDASPLVGAAPPEV